MRGWLVWAKGEGMKVVIRRPEGGFCQVDRWRFQLSRGSDGGGACGATPSVMFIKLRSAGCIRSQTCHGKDE